MKTLSKILREQMAKIIIGSIVFGVAMLVFVLIVSIFTLVTSGFADLHAPHPWLFVLIVVAACYGIGHVIMKD